MDSDYNARIQFVLFTDKLFPFNCYNFRQCLDTSCATKSVFSLSAIKASVQLPRNHWSSCWSDCGASRCCVLLDVEYTNGFGPMDGLLWILCRHCCRQFHSSDYCVATNTDSIKCGQTTRSDVTFEVQTSCDFEARPSNSCRRLDPQHCLRINVVLGVQCRKNLRVHFTITLPFGISCLLVENISDSSPPCSWGTRTCSPKPIKWKCTTELETIQEDGIYCGMGPDIITHLLYTPYYGYSTIFC